MDKSGIIALVVIIALIAAALCNIAGKDRT